MGRSKTHASLSLQSDLCNGADLKWGRFCIVAIECNIRSRDLARTSTSIASKPFLAMIIDCQCASFIDETTTSLSSQALIDVDHCCCFA